jgi:Leucine-rich repeat (LRR) protein
MTSIFSLISILLVLGIATFFGIRSFSTSSQPSDESQIMPPQGNENILSAIDAAKEAKQTIESNNDDVDGVETIDLSGQGLTKVPMYVFEQTDTVALNLSNNALTGALQAEIRHLGRLKSLDLSHNMFTGVPAEIGQLQRLETLDLSYNKLTGLPYELGNLSQLKLLDLRGNAYSEADLETIKKTLPDSVVIKT